MDAKTLESVSQQIIETFQIYAPPIPIETMLQQPVAGLWEQVDVSQLSGSFLSIRERFSPRMSLARLLARHIANSAWGRGQGLQPLLQDNDLLHAFARMLIMPADMVLNMTGSSRNASGIANYFEVPEEDARTRLQELLMY